MFSDEKKLYSALPFPEKEFAIWMDQLEYSLLTYSEWRDLLIYKDVSVFDSAYSSIYWDTLNAYRQFYNSFQNNYNINNILPVRHSNNALLKMKNGEMRIIDGIPIVINKLIRTLIMNLPSRKFPSVLNHRNALVVRAFKNSSGFPILTGLKTSGWNVVFTSWNENLEKPIKLLEIPYYDIKKIYRRKYLKCYTTHEKQVNTLMNTVDCLLPSTLLSKMSTYPLNWDVLKSFSKYIITSRTFIDVYLDMLDQIKPQIVILFNENSVPGRTMALVARKSGIPSVAIQHGLYIGHVYRNLATDKIIVWGEEPKKFWGEKGCSPDRIISVGSFAHENLIASLPLSKKEADYPRPRILFLGQNPAAFISRATHQNTISAIVEATKSLPQFDFIIRPHPSEDSNPYNIAVNKSPLNNNVKIQTNDSLVFALQNCDVVITVFSTAGLEAMLMERPVIVLDLSGEPPLAPYVASSALVLSSEELSSTIERVVNNFEVRKTLIEAGKKYAESYLGPFDGQSIKRAVKAIERIAKIN